MCNPFEKITCPGAENGSELTCDEWQACRKKNGNPAPCSDDGYFLKCDQNARCKNFTCTTTGMVKNPSRVHGKTKKECCKAIPAPPAEEEAAEQAAEQAEEEALEEIGI